MWKVTERTAEEKRLRGVSGFTEEAVEDHLGVALIQPGDSVIIK